MQGLRLGRPQTSAGVNFWAAQVTTTNRVPVFLCSLEKYGIYDDFSISQVRISRENRKEECWKTCVTVTVGATVSFDQRIQLGKNPKWQSMRNGTIIGRPVTAPLSWWQSVSITVSSQKSALCKHTILTPLPSHGPLQGIHWIHESAQTWSEKCIRI